MDLTVLFFATDVAHQSGASYALRETVRRVASQGARTIVVLPDNAESRQVFPANEFEAAYIPMQRIRNTLNPATQGKSLFLLAPTIARLCRIIRERSVDIVHFNEYRDLHAGFAARLTGIPCVCHIRAPGIPRHYRWLLRNILKSTVDAIVVPSKSTERWIAADLKGLASRVNLIHDFAFDMDLYDPTLSGSVFRSELGVSNDVPVVVLVSKLLKWKGHEIFIKAAELVLKEAEGVRFVIVGSAVDGHEQDSNEIQALAEKLVPQEALSFVGLRTDLPLIYAASDIAVHCPTYPDPYPTVVLLPMLMGKPVIGSDIGGIPEQIEDNVTGILVPSNDPTALARAILQLVRDADKRKSLGSTAMARSRESFAPAKQARMLIDLYEGLLGRQWRT
jgi:glycosyltransferase involved in cell wall biosynthesis